MSLRKTLGLFARTGYYLKESWKEDCSVPDLQKKWAEETLRNFNIDLKTYGDAATDRPLLLIGNHISYLDIVLLMAAVPNVSFVAKKELAQWPIFGSAAKAMNTIFVDRSCSNSRTSARDAIRQGLLAGKRIVVFPSGTTALDESKAWRYGAFEIAHEVGARVQPFRLTYTPLRLSAYIDKDFFPWHLYGVARAKQITATLEFSPPHILSEPRSECHKWHKWTQELVNL